MLTGSRLWFAMAALMFADVLSQLESSMIFATLPAAARQFGSVSSAGWLFTAFALVAAGTAAVGGRLGDLYGRRRVLTAIVLLSGLGSIVCILGSNHLGWMIAGRAIQGLSGAILPLAYGIVREIAPPQRAPFWIGTLAGVYGLTAGAGLIIGGLFSDAGHWQGIFYVTAIVPLFVAPALMFAVPPSVRYPRSGSIDIVGGLLFVPAIAGVLASISMADRLGMSMSLALGLGSAILLAFWVFHELRCKFPLIDVRLLRNSQVALGNFIIVSCGIGQLQSSIMLMLLIQQPTWTGVGLGLSATFASFVKLPAHLLTIVAGPLCGIVAQRFGTRTPMFYGSLAAAVAWLSITLFHGTVAEIMFGYIVAAFGTMMILAGVPNILLAVAPESRSSEVLGLSSAIRTVSMAIGAQVITMILDASSIQSGSKSYPDAHAFTLACLYITMTGVACLIGSLGLASRRQEALGLKIAARV